MAVPFRIAGLGRALPAGRVTNADLEARMDTTDEWIRTRTGIEERPTGGTVTALGTAAARGAIDAAGSDVPEIGAVVLATSTADEAIPAGAALIAGELGLSCATLDVNGACAGFVYALVAAGAFLRPATSVLVVGADVMSRITDPDDRSTAILFADGAGAALLAPTDVTTAGLVGWHAGTRPDTHDLLWCEPGGTIRMQGQAVFKVAVQAGADSALAALEDAGLTAADVDLLVPHQANQRITDALARRLDLPDDRVVSTIARTGNSSAGSIPLALADAHAAGRVRDGDVVVLCGFGAGMTWASAVLRWSAT